MARLKNNGEVVLRCTKPDEDWRVMSNGRVLSKQDTGGFTIYCKLEILTFREVKDLLSHDGWTVEVLAPWWLDLRPAPTKRIMRKAPVTAREERWVSQTNPGLLRAKVNQGK